MISGPTWLPWVASEDGGATDRVSSKSSWVPTGSSIAIHWFWWDDDDKDGNDNDDDDDDGDDDDDDDDDE